MSTEAGAVNNREEILADFQVFINCWGAQVDLLGRVLSTWGFDSSVSNEQVLIKQAADATGLVRWFVS